MKPILNLYSLLTTKKVIMKRWSLVAVVITLFLTATLLVGRQSNASDKKPISSTEDSSKASDKSQAPKRLVDGSANPDNIPSEVAYSIFFRILTGGKNDTARSHSRALAKSLALSDQDIKSLFVVAEQFHQQVSNFDNTAKNIKDKYHPDHSRIPTIEDRGVLADLQKKKDSLVLKLASDLPQRLSPDGWYKVHRYVQETIRRKTKIAFDDEN